MLTSDYDYDLPSGRIAQEPLAERSSARMMVLAGTAPPAHAKVRDLPKYLRSGDLLVFNDTRVIPARVSGAWSDTGGAVELLLIEPVGPGCWHALCRSGRPVRARMLMRLADGAIKGEVVNRRDDGSLEVALDSADPLLDVLDRCGRTPLPPYIKRRQDDPLEGRDRESYQTVFAREPGAVAAPTAGLHFNAELLDNLRAAGIQHAFVTLHVGPGTFRPVSAELAADHIMDAERYHVSPETAEVIRSTRASGGRIVAVGSTTVRTLETMAAEHGGPTPCRGRSRLFIKPPYRFLLTDVLLTNFHLPRSTLLMMVAAFAGRERILDAYREALEEGYRFFSYGDCMLLS